MRVNRWAMGAGVLLMLILGLLLISWLRFGMMGQGYRGPGMMGYYGSGGGSMMAGWSGWWVLVLSRLVVIGAWIAAIAAVVVFLRRASLAPGATTVGRPDDALTIAQRRYAAGEIDRDTFVQMRQDLQETPTTV